jgi:hypothetical protein
MTTPLLTKTPFNESDEDSVEDIEEAKEIARERLRVWRNRAIYSAVAFFLSCVSVIPFLEGYRLHTYWRFGKNLVLLSMGLLIPFVFCTVVLFGAYSCLRDLETGDK